jgi:2'-5' RNA ligase
MMDYADYLLLLSPPEAVKTEIARYKKASVRAIGKFESMNSPAHISIFKAERQKAFMMEPALKRMEAKLNTMPPVAFHITGFNFFKHGEKAMTIYAEIKESEAVIRWFRLLSINLNLKTKNITPHITVARNITVEQFGKLWPHFAKAKYVDLFWIKELIVLKRETFGQEPKWERHKIMAFKNQFTATANNI